MPLQLVKRTDHSKKYDVAIALKFDPDIHSSKNDFAMTADRYDDIICCGVDLSEAVQIRKQIEEGLRKIFAEEGQICNRLALIPMISESHVQDVPVLLDVVRDAVMPFLWNSEVMIDLILPDQINLVSHESRLGLYKEYLAQHYTEYAEDFIEQVLAGILGKLMVGMTLPAAKLKSDDKKVEKLSQIIPQDIPRELREFIEEEQSDSFYQTLKKEIDKRNMTEVECYKRANISRKLYSKIKKQPFYKPSKQTAAAFAIALRMDLDDANNLLSSAGYQLTGASLFDMIIKYHIQKKEYDIYVINNLLYDFDQCMLGG